ncbi:hypothetical protein Mapa_002964 [Marchantia paleacea]|nr:hypothetical protein Mapa_002964 [Marchantia paleacea]
MRSLRSFKLHTVTERLFPTLLSSSLLRSQTSVLRRARERLESPSNEAIFEPDAICSPDAAADTPTIVEDAIASTLQRSHSRRNVLTTATLCSCSNSLLRCCGRGPELVLVLDRTKDSGLSLVGQYRVAMSLGISSLWLTAPVPVTIPGLKISTLWPRSKCATQYCPISAPFFILLYCSRAIEPRPNIRTRVSRRTRSSFRYKACPLNILGPCQDGSGRSPGFAECQEGVAEDFRLRGPDMRRREGRGAMLGVFAEY